MRGSGGQEHMGAPVSELLIAGGTVVTADRMEPADVLIRDGRIADVGQDLTTGGEVLDARGHWVMPGGIDTHTHLAHPIDRLGITTADDFHTGTVAGACGGVTTIIDFSLQRRGETLALARDRRLGEIAPDAVIDYGFHTIVTDVRDDVIAEVPELIGGGFPSFKVYMTYGDKIVNDDGLLRLLEATGANGGLLYVHCENDCAVTYLINQHLSDGKTGPAYHAPS
ncbi:MAG: amidohydrolase family protein, partial [Gammaproteobacteria bacterium]|nr:amidohydrolase family protein [Gammaproteobacteria bacterium]